MKPNISALLLSLVVLIGITSMVRADQRCRLSAAGSPLKHIVFLEFDNLHLERDVPSVPADRLPQHRTVRSRSRPVSFHERGASPRRKESP